MNRDQMNHTPVAQAANAALRTLDAIQGLPQHQQIIGTAILFRLLSERMGIEAQDVMTVAGNIIDATDDAGQRIEVNAIRDYLANEV